MKTFMHDTRFSGEDLTPDIELPSRHIIRKNGTGISSASELLNMYSAQI